MVKIKQYINPERNNKWNDGYDEITVNSSEIAQICLNCPLPTCPKKRVCPRYEEEIKKLKAKEGKKIIKNT